MTNSFGMDLMHCMLIHVLYCTLCVMHERYTACVMHEMCCMHNACIALCCMFGACDALHARFTLWAACAMHATVGVVLFVCMTQGLRCMHDVMLVIWCMHHECVILVMCCMHHECNALHNACWALHVHAGDSHYRARIIEPSCSSLNTAL